MSALPPRFACVILTFARLFHQATWHYAQQLLTGAILAPGIRTVASVLRILGAAEERRFVNYHRVLSRAPWRPRAASRLLLRLLVRAFVPAGPVVFGIDDTLERRRGRCIRAKGVYHDPVRSSHSHFVKATGLRWLSVMLLAPIPWAKRVWALPFLTALAPSSRYNEQRGARHKTLTDWARQLLRQTARWCAVLAPERSLIMVADSSFAVLELLAALASQMTCITRLRLDAQLYAPAPPRPMGTRGAPRKKGARLPSLAAVLTDPATRWQRVTVPGWYGSAPREIELTSGTGVWYHSGMPVVPLRWVLVRDPRRRFDPQALLSTDPALAPVAIVQYFVRRWQVEVTFEEARRHLGLETQRQWSDQAIARTTPILLSLFSLVTLCATRLLRAGTLPVRQSAWYHKGTPTFSDALGAVRREWWHVMGFSPSGEIGDVQKSPSRRYGPLIEALIYAA
jgi:hypothetical protein